MVLSSTSTALSSFRKKFILRLLHRIYATLSHLIDSVFFCSQMSEYEYSARAQDGPLDMERN